MSWNDYVTAYLTNYVDQTTGKAHTNSCEHGAIISVADGTVWASTSGFSIHTSIEVHVDKEDGTGQETKKINEFENLKNAFENEGSTNNVGGLRLNGEKFFLVSFNKDKQVAYLKKNGGGAAVSKSGQAFVIGTFSTAKKVTITFNGANSEVNQNPGLTNTGVEKLQEFLVANNL